METVNNTTMHVTETKALCSSLACPEPKSEELTKDQEEELLCGNSEDGDEEDALSDDSMRLRYSDDEAENDESFAPGNVTSKKGDQEKASNMELGSDVPPTDTEEHLSALTNEKPPNGSCAVESNEIRVDREDEKSNDQFFKDTVPETSESCHASNDSTACNQDSSEALKVDVKPTVTHLITDKPSGNKTIFEYFKGNSKRMKMNSRKSYTKESKQITSTDSYCNRYYNVNSNFGGCKESGRTYNSYMKKSPSLDGSSDGKCWAKLQPDVSSDKSVNAQNANDFPQPIKLEKPETTETPEHPIESEDPSEAIDDVASNNVKTESEEAISTNETIINEDTNEFPNNDNVESNIVDNLDSEKIPENVDSSRNTETFNDKSNTSGGGENDDDNVSNSSAATLVEDKPNDIIEEPSMEDKDDVKADVESKCESPHDLGLATEDAEKDFIPEAMEAEESLAPECDKTEDTQKVDVHLESEKTDESETNEIVEKDNCESEKISVEKPASLIETDEVPEVEPVASNDCSLEKAEEALAAEIERCDEEANSEQMKKDDPTESLKPEASDEEKKTEEKEDTIVVSGDEDKECNVVDTEKTPQESPIDETTESGETIDKDIVSGDGETATEPKTAEIESDVRVLSPEKKTSSDNEADDEVKNVRLMNGSLKRKSIESLDEMELCKRMRIRRKKNGIDEECNSKEQSVEISLTEDTEIINRNDNSVTNSIAEIKSSSESEESSASNNVVDYSENKSNDHSINKTPNLLESTTKSMKSDDCDIVEVPTKKQHKRTRRSIQATTEEPNSQGDIPEKENVRQKRRTAKNAEEIIRAKCLDHSDSESNDSVGNLVAYNKTSNSLRPASPPSLKRDYSEEDEKVEPSTLKKLKHDFESNGDVVKTPDKTQTLAHVRKFFRRDGNGKLVKLKQEELEELLIQKVVETITMRDEIGRLREQARISERNQEATRLRCQQLAKQIKDFDMVLNRYESDRRANPDKTVVPIKINRSVGLQVNFVTEHGIQNLRNLALSLKPTTPTVNGISTPQQTEQPPSNPPTPVRRNIKVRSPRQSEPPVIAPVVGPSPTQVHSQPIVSNIAPAALVVAKNVTDSRTPVTATGHQTTVPHPIAPKPAILVNGPITPQPIRQPPVVQASKPKNNDLIDLTEEEDKTKSNVLPKKTVLTTAVNETSPNISNVQKIAPRYHTVIQTLPGNVAITAPSGIRVVQPSNQPTPTALVNNMNAPRLTYIVPSGMGSARQVVVTSAPTPIRPSPTIRTTFPLSGTITNGTVRMIHMNAGTTLQVYKHPAALPESMHAASSPAWKLPPPAPSLKISKVANGIVLSWNMVLSDKYAEIASYQLYAYQEVSGIPPSSTLWKKVGDVRALPLPMACTLTQFSEGNNYYFAVRAVDKHSRLGLYSQPGNISL